MIVSESCQAEEPNNIHWYSFSRFPFSFPANTICWIFSTNVSFDQLLFVISHWTLTSNLCSPVSNFDRWQKSKTAACNNFSKIRHLLLQNYPMNSLEQDFFRKMSSGQALLVSVQTLFPLHPKTDSPKNSKADAVPYIALRESAGILSKMFDVFFINQFINLASTKHRRATAPLGLDKFNG